MYKGNLFGKNIFQYGGSNPSTPRAGSVVLLDLFGTAPLGAPPGGGGAAPLCLCVMEIRA